MNVLKAIKRNSASTGQVNKLRSDGFIPAVLYGGKKSNLNISLKKLHLKDLIKAETFMSKVFDLDIDGTSEKVLPRDVAYDPVSDEPIHVDFMRIAKGSKLVLEIPVKFVNTDKSPGLKKGGVLNVVRRKIELKCPTENIPNEIIVDLEKSEINTSLKISSVKLPENVIPTITERDFVIATVVAPTILVEPEKTEEAAAEGEVPAEGAAEAAVEGESPVEEGKDKTAKVSDDKIKTTATDKAKSGKPSSEDKTKSASGDKGKSSNKETKKK
ncbi:50S ribosomal protein L25/general stress protein Ctc [Pelagibacteraceae bacterium]|nr:50S ribosomal protein L25/general stress protein Ctc [Pelagibacteraceae bacterium]